MLDPGGWHHRQFGRIKQLVLDHEGSRLLENLVGGNRAKAGY